MIELDRKLLDLFQGFVVRKDIVRAVKVEPTYLYSYWNTCLPTVAVPTMRKKSGREWRA